MMNVLRLVLSLGVLLPAVLVGQEGDGAAEAERPLRTNTFMMGVVEAWAQQAGMRVQRFGDGSFRVMTIGTMPGELDPAAMVAAGEQAHLGLDTWIGRNDLLPIKDLPDERVGWVVLLPRNADFDRFLAWARKEHEQLRHNGEGEDLTAKLRSLNTPRMGIQAIERIQVARSIHYAIYTACNQAVDTWFGEHTDGRAPWWLREGLNAELQRLIPEGEPRVFWRTISYENSDSQMGSDWNQVLRTAIEEEDPLLIRASWVLEVEPIALPAVQYVQMWSLCRYLVAGARSRKGDRNKFYQLFMALAEGADSKQAVEQVYGKADPELTRAWYNWVTSQR